MPGDAVKMICAVLVLLAAVSLQAATTLEVVIPNNSTTAVPFNLTVTARNGAAVDTAYAGTVYFTSSDATATLPAGYTFTPADAGTRSFTATMNRAGSGIATANHTLTATDTANATVTGVDVTTVRWNDNVVRRFFIAVPAVVDRNVPFTVEMRALNASHFVVPTYTGTIHFTALRNEVLPADYTFTAADAGVRTFTVTATMGGHSQFSVQDFENPPAGGLAQEIRVVCPELVASATNSGPMCQGGSAILFGSANLPVVDYSWVSSIGRPPLFQSHEQNPIVVNPYTYSLTVRQANECTATAQATVTRHQTETAQVSLAPAAICGGGNFTATLQNAPSYSGIEWSVDGGTIVSGHGTPAIEVAPNAGATSVAVAVEANETSSGCAFYQWIGAVPVGGAAVTEITTGAAACPLTTQHAHVADAGVGATYAWTITNGTITSGEGTRAIQYSANGTGDVTLAVSVANGSCSASDTATVAVGPMATVDAELSLCGDGEAEIPVALTGTAPFRIVWSDGVVQENINSTSATRTVQDSGAYSIAIVSDTNCNGLASGTAEVFFGAQPEITEEPRGAMIKAGETATLTVAVNASNVVYRWYEGRAGDRTKLVSVELDPFFTTPVLHATTSYWVEVENDCGASESRTAVVAVGGGRRRSARH